MKKTLKVTYVLTLTLVLTTFGCNNDDEGSINEVIVNDEISVQNLNVTIDENPTNGQTIGMVETEGGGVLSFSIASQTPTGALSINSITGELTVADVTLFDHEVNPVLTAIIAVAGAENSGTVTINLNDLNEIGVQDLTVAIDENPMNGQNLGTVQVDGNGPLSFSIETQTPAGAISIDESTGELTVADATLFDYETNPIIIATISVDDAESPATATINLTNLNEVTLQDAVESIDENPTNGQIVGTVQTSEGVGVNFNITSQSPAGALNIDANSGELSVADAALFDFETNATITATITADGAINPATVIIDVNNIDEIGDFNYGGVIFWLDGNGGGLVCDIVDQVNPTPNQGIGWSIGTNTNTGATGQNIGTGQANTTAIINNHGAGVYAAALCDNSTSAGYSDWYLPSLFELSEIYLNLATVNNTSLANGGTEIIFFYYWSSTEVNTDQARIMVNNGGVASQVKNNSGAFVRAIRTFTNI
ncbi:hypothetical protein [Maribacter halichondriae]|uniref:hypothetical protein n=1 Tax=Maribacter halichondriae TaxID=2980554 RepID=UPI00235A0F8E|nr:hypothetical protein [Maribacter sp. Hal144]